MTQAGAGGWNDKSLSKFNFTSESNKKKNLKKFPIKRLIKFCLGEKQKFGGKDLESFVVAKLNCCFRACFGSAGHG